MRFLRLILLSCLLAPAFAASLDEDERLEFANGLYAREMYEFATAEYRAFLRDFPESGKADTVHFRLGESLRQQRKFVEAEKEFRTVFLKYPQSEFRFKAGFKRAGIFLEGERYDSAVDLYRALIDAGPPAEIASASYYYLGEALARLDKREEAVQALEQVTARYATSGFYCYALLKLGEIRTGKGQESRALEAYNAVLAKPASDRVAAEALFQIAELHSRLKDFQKSAAAFKRLLAEFPADPRSSEARLRAAWAIHGAGLYADALATVREALEKGAGAEEPEWLYLKANCERQLAKNDDAAATYSDLLKRFPTSEYADAALYEKALTHYRMGRFKDAVQGAGLVRAIPELRKDVYWLLAESYAAMEDTDNAIQYYRLLVKEFPASDIAADAHYRLGHQLQDKGEYKEASRYYSILAAGFPESKLVPRALFASAFCLAKAGTYDKAARDWDTLIRKYPSHPLVEEAMYQKAMAQTRVGMDAEALAALQKLVAGYPQTKFAADAHYWQGILLAKTDRTREAIGQFRLAIERKPGPDLDRDIRFNLAVALQKAGELKESAGLLQALLGSPAAGRVPPELLEWLAEYRFDARQYDLSMAAAKLLVERKESPAWEQIGWGLLGRAHLALADRVAAKDAFEKSLAVKAKTFFAAESALRLGDIAFEAGEHETAAGYFEQAAARTSSQEALEIRANAYAGLARTAKATSDLESAAKYFMSVAILYDDNKLVPECLYEAAMIFKQMDKTDESLRAARELKERYPQSEWAAKPGLVDEEGGE